MKKNCLQLVPTPKDGHCLLHAVILSWKSQIPSEPPPSLHDLQCAIFAESINNRDTYKGFLDFNSNLQYVKSVSDYVIHRIYDSAFGDLIPLVIANAISLTLRIINANVKDDTQDIVVSPSSGQSMKTITIHRDADHYCGVMTKTIKTYTKSELISLRSSPGRLQRKVRKRLFEFALWKPAGLNYPEFAPDSKPLRKDNGFGHNSVNLIKTRNLERLTIKSVRNAGVCQTNLARIHTAAPTIDENLATMGLLNARSARQQDQINNKPMEIHDLIIDKNLDIMILTETWFKDNCLDRVAMGDMTPNGYRLRHLPRPHKRGGGLAIIYKADLTVNTLHPASYSSFECFTTCIKHRKVSFHLAAVYRPPQSSPSSFFTEFSDMVEILSSHQNHIILGDFNFPVNKLDHPNSRKLMTILDCANYHQIVNVPTHVNGNTLDLIAYPSTSSIQTKLHDVDHSVSSDHLAVIFSLKFPKPVRLKKVMNVRKWKSIDISKFNKEITHKYEISSIPDPVSAYNTILTDLLDKYAPSKQIKTTERPSTPWYCQEIRHAKTECRKLERKWLKSNLSIDHEILKTQRNRLKSLREIAKAKYIKSKLENVSSPKDSFDILNHLLHKSTERPLPAHCDTTILAEKFASFFMEKIALRRNNFHDVIPPPPQSLQSLNFVSLLDSFRPTVNCEINKLVSQARNKSCALDPVPTWLVKQCPALIPLLRDIVNSSFRTGTMTNSLKRAHILPALKKTSLDAEDLKNYRPISNLAFSSKLIERVVSIRLQEHCDLNNISMDFQSAYRLGHSTETALVRVQNDLLEAVDRQGGAALVLLDLSAAFDTIDHQILLDILRTEIGISSLALQWFQSYLSDRYQAVKIGTSLSTRKHLAFGVPQGSVLGPQLFSLYTRPLQKVIENSGMQFHLYADDTQLYIAVDPSSAISVADVTQKITDSVRNIKSWMRSHFLQLNSDKTELLIVSSPSVRAQTLTSLSICDSIINASECVKDLGVQFDRFLNLEPHVRSVCKRAYYQIHLVSKIRKFITEDSARTLIQSNVTTLLDYCNCLLVGLPDSLIALLQRVQNCAARIIKCVNKYSHVTPILKELHWLPIKFRIDYKVILLTFKALNNLAPSYLMELIQPYQPRRSLRSSGQNLLQVPSYRTKRYGARSFAYVGPQLWNNLPDNMRNMSDLSTFKTALKTHLFNLAFKDCS